jgi:BMFP domain-containing protein YqiC
MSTATEALTEQRLRQLEQRLAQVEAKLGMAVGQPPKKAPARS